MFFSDRSLIIVFRLKEIFFSVVNRSRTQTEWHHFCVFTSITHFRRKTDSKYILELNNSLMIMQLFVSGNKKTTLSLFIYTFIRGSFSATQVRFGLIMQPSLVLNLVSYLRLPSAEFRVVSHCHVQVAFLIRIYIFFLLW